MTELCILDDSIEWQKDFERRLSASYTGAGLGAAAAECMIEDVCARIGDWTVAEIRDAGARVGYVAVVVEDGNGALAGRIGDLHVDAPHADQGHKRAARDWAEEWCVERGARHLHIRLTESLEGDEYAIPSLKSGAATEACTVQRSLVSCALPPG